MKKFAEGGEANDEVFRKIKRGLESRKSERKTEALQQGLQGAGKVAKQAALAAIPGGQLYANPRELAAGAKMTKDAFDEYRAASKKSIPDDEESDLVRQIPKGRPTPIPKPERLNSEENKEATSETFKKGGSVRGWGIARGARKAKIR